MRKAAHVALKTTYPMEAAYDWENIARKEQTPPPDDWNWTTWLVLGGRGAGKTRSGAEWIRSIIKLLGRKYKARIALVAESYADAREVMIEGPTGVRAVERPSERPSYIASRRLLVWPNGSEAYCFSAEDPDGIRGYQFDAAWADELCKWRYPEETWSNLQLALRLGPRPRQVVTTTPRPMALLKRLMKSPTTVNTKMSSFDNKDNLAVAFFTEITSAYEGTALGRQELLGELVEDLEGALWSWRLIEASRISRAPVLDRIVVAVDPPATTGPDADECGIVVAGTTEIAQEDTGFVIADRSVQGLSPRKWAERAVAAYHEFEADRIVVEVNQGGDMVRAIIDQVDPSVPVREVRATRGKRLRAEPVAALYERGLVRHAGTFSKLEDQMTSFIGASSRSGAGKSPDRLDALVWALTELLLKPAAPRPAVRRLN